MVVALIVLAGGCTRDRPPPPSPAQLRTVHRLIEEIPPPDDGLLDAGRHVFLGSEARPVLSAARTYTAGLICEPSPAPTKHCRARRPPALPPADHAVLMFDESAGMQHTATHHGAATEHGGANRAVDGQPAPGAAAGGAAPPGVEVGPPARPVLLAPGVDTPVGDLTRAQIFTARTYGIPSLASRGATSPAFVVPPSAILRLSYGVEQAAWHVDSAPVYFRVVYEDEHGATQDLFRRILDPARNPLDRRWYDNDVDLSDLEGKTIRLRFLSEPAKSGDTRPSLPVWGDPRILAPTSGPKRPAIVLVSLDTLRAKSMSLYGYARDTTPRTTRLATRGTVFDDAFTPFPSTLGAHMSMLTGLLPATHGVRDATYALADQHLLLAEVLRGAGYATGAFTEDALLDSRRGFRRGFSAYHEDTTIQAGGGDAEATFGRALAWAAGHADEPFFLFVHTYQVHDPYDPPVAYRDLFPSDGVSDAQRRYEQEIRYLDDLLQRLVDGLHRLVPEQDLLLVVTADHGEEFFEHGLPTHLQLFDEVMHVPLLFVWPPRVPAGRRITEPVSLVDVLPTVLQLVGVDVPPGIDGVSLVPLLSATPATLDRTMVLGEYPPLGGESARHLVARSRDAKCIVDDGGARTRCWDLAADPGETTARAPQDDPRFAPVAAAARAYGQRGAAPSPGATPAEPAAESIERKMRALGYVQ